MRNSSENRTECKRDNCKKKNILAAEDLRCDTEDGLEDT